MRVCVWSFVFSSVIQGDKIKNREARNPTYVDEDDDDDDDYKQAAGGLDTAAQA